MNAKNHRGDSTGNLAHRISGSRCDDSRDVLDTAGVEESQRKDTRVRIFTPEPLPDFARACEELREMSREASRAIELRLKEIREGKDVRILRNGR